MLEGRRSVLWYPIRLSTTVVNASRPWASENNECLSSLKWLKNDFDVMAGSAFHGFSLWQWLVIALSVAGSGLLAWGWMRSGVMRWWPR